MAIPREVTQGLQLQGVDEQIPYTITTTPWGSSPTNVSVVAKNEATSADVTSTVFPTNSPSVSGNVITLSLMKSLTAGTIYRVEVKFTTGSTIWETYFRVRGET